MERTPKALKVLTWLTSAVFVVALYLVLIWAPQEAIMGDVQRVFYFHVAAGWVGALAFLVTAIVGGIYLARGEQRWDRIAVSSVEIGIVFTLINIVTGSIWARPIWNTWWTWEPRLTTAAIVELIYAAYLLLRQGVDDPERRARFSAIYAIFGFFSVPLTFISIRMLRTIHPVVIGSAEAASQGGFNMDSPMKLTFFFSLAAFTVFFADLLWHRIRLGQLRAEVDVLRIDSYSKGE